MSVVEVRGRGGQILDRHRCKDSTIAIGRAFDNDLILEDEYVSPHHLRLRRVDGGWHFEDLGSLNGLRHNGRIAVEGVLRSGDELRLGHSSLHVYDDEHEVAPARLLTGAEARLAALGRPLLCSTLIVASVAISAIGLFWNTLEEFEPLTVVQPLLMQVLMTVAIAAGWALVGRLLRHRAFFGAHLSLWLILGLLDALVTFVAQGVGFNANSERVEAALEMGLSLAVLAFVVWGSLTLATPLRRAGRTAAALGVASTFLAVGLAGELQFEREFSPRPDYYGRLMAPRLRFARPVGEAELVGALPRLFDRAEADAEEDAAE